MDRLQYFSGVGGSILRVRSGAMSQKHWHKRQRDI
jgi:oxalate decarboxylase/phosphoglucose isomerase-like protein (cupin superfamily)